MPKDDNQRFALFRAWLRLCDKTHDCTASRRTVEMPTRLLHVADTDNLRLVSVGDIAKPHDSGASIRTNGYIALSHCWGKTDPGKVPPYCTTKSNRTSREIIGFKATDLPRTFQDAIETVRGLGLQYLWIDSLCIIQDDEQDWERESSAWKDAYASAYCTLAATSAIDSFAGFLERKVNNEYICVRDDSDQQSYVRIGIADFDEEVEKAELNKRAWVLQERLLSCRTIHFGAKQAYWECGEGVRGEDLTRMEW